MAWAKANGLTAGIAATSETALAEVQGCKCGIVHNCTDRPPLTYHFLENAMPHGGPKPTPLAMLGFACAWLRAASRPPSGQGFDCGPLCDVTMVSGRRASRHIDASPPARVEQRARFSQWIDVQSCTCAHSQSSYALDGTPPETTGRQRAVVGTRLIWRRHWESGRERTLCSCAQMQPCLCALTTAAESVQLWPSAIVHNCT